MTKKTSLCNRSLVADDKATQWSRNSGVDFYKTEACALKQLLQAVTCKSLLGKQMKIVL
jgi:hypothetical protein